MLRIGFFIFVTHIIQNWNQAVRELVQWERLGRDVALAREYV